MNRLAKFNLNPEIHLHSLSLAVFGLGVGMLLITLLSLGQENVSYARTEWTALLAMALAVPALLIYAHDPGAANPWWRSFWTAAAIAYLFHFWWAVFRTYHGDFGAVLSRQGFVALSNFLVTMVWPADVLLAWLPSLYPHKETVDKFRIFTALLVGISFFMSTAIFRSGLESLFGWLFGLAAAVVIWHRYHRLHRVNP